MKASQSDAEIVAALASRGIEPGRAATLVDDLRHGHTPTFQLPFGPDTAPHHGTSQPRASAGPVPQPLRAPQVRSHRRTHKHPPVQWELVLVVLIFIAALGYALFGSGEDASQETIDQTKPDISFPARR